MPRVSTKDLVPNGIKVSHTITEHRDRGKAKAIALPGMSQQHLAALGRDSVAQRFKRLAPNPALWLEAIGRQLDLQHPPL